MVLILKDDRRYRAKIIRKDTGFDCTMIRI